MHKKIVFSLFVALLLAASAVASSPEEDDEYRRFIKEFGNGAEDIEEEPSFDEESDLEVVSDSNSELGPDFQIRAEKPTLEVESVDTTSDIVKKEASAVNNVQEVASQAEKAAKVSPQQLEADENLAKQFWHIDDVEEAADDSIAVQDDLDLAPTQKVTVPATSNVHDLVNKMVSASQNAAATTEAELREAQQEQNKAAALRETKANEYKAAIDSLRAAKTAVVKKQRELRVTAKACSEVTDTAEKKANLLENIESRLKNLHEVVLEQGPTRSLEKQHYHLAELINDLAEGDITAIDDSDSTFEERRARAQKAIVDIRAHAAAASETCGVEVESLRSSLASLHENYHKLIAPTRATRSVAIDAAKKLVAAKQKTAVLSQVVAREKKVAAEQVAIAHAIVAAQ